MARPGLYSHRKFLRLERAIGSRPLAAGVLELLWSPSYETGDAFLGDADDIAARVGWTGDTDALVRALADAGGTGRAGFIEPVPGQDGQYQIHDLADHAPNYMHRRAVMEAERSVTKACVRCHTPFHSPDVKAKYCSNSCRTAAWRKNKRDGACDAGGDEAPPTDSDADCDARGDAGVTHERSVTNDNATPAPAPAPNPSVEGTKTPAPLALIHSEPAPDPIATSARVVLAALNEARKASIPNARALKPSDANLAGITARLRGGASVEDCLHVIAVRRREVELGGDPQWFDAITPFRAENFAKSEALSVENVKPKAPPKSKPEPARHHDTENLLVANATRSRSAT